MSSAFGGGGPTADGSTSSSVPFFALSKELGGDKTPLVPLLERERELEHEGTADGGGKDEELLLPARHVPVSTTVLVVIVA